MKSQSMVDQLSAAEIDVTAIIAQTLQVDPATLTPDSSMFNTPNWDSLAHLTIITAIETALGRQFGIDEIASATSVRDLCAIVAKSAGGRQ